MLQVANVADGEKTLIQHSMVASFLKSSVDDPPHDFRDKDDNVMTAVDEISSDFTFAIAKGKVAAKFRR